MAKDGKGNRGPTPEGDPKYAVCAQKLMNVVGWKNNIAVFTAVETLSVAQGRRPPSQTTINNLINRGLFSPLVRDAFCDAVQAQIGATAELVAFRTAAPTRKHRGEAKPKPKTMDKAATLMAALRRLEWVSPDEREAALIALFGSVTEKCSAFLGVVTPGRLPLPFEKPQKSRELRGAIYGAVDRDSKCLFVAPDEALVAKQIDYFGVGSVPSVQDFHDGFNSFRDGYVTHLIELGLAEARETGELADQRFAMVHHPDLNCVASRRYIASYIGSGCIQGVEARLAERGPASGYKFTVQPHDPDSEIGMREYLGKVLDSTEHQIHPVLLEELRGRMRLRR